MDMKQIKELKENDELTVGETAVIVRQVAKEDDHLEVLLQDENEQFYALVGHGDHAHCFSLEAHGDHFHPKEEIDIKTVSKN